MKISVLVCLSSLRSTHCHCSHLGWEFLAVRTMAVIWAVVLVLLSSRNCRPSKDILAQCLPQTVCVNLLDPP